MIPILGAFAILFAVLAVVGAMALVARAVRAPGRPKMLPGMRFRLPASPWVFQVTGRTYGGTLTYACDGKRLCAEASEIDAVAIPVTDDGWTEFEEFRKVRRELTVLPGGKP